MSSGQPGSFALAFAAGFSLAAAGAVLLWPVDEPDVARYREVRDWTRSAYVHGVGDEELIDHALRGLAGGLDTWSAWYGRSELQRLDRETEGRFQGLGVSIKAPVSEGRILFPLPGSPAEAAGILPGDRILRVDGRSWVELGHEGFRALVSTPEPRAFEIQVAGLDGAERRVVVTTASVVEPTVRHERIADPERGLGYVALRAFSHESPAELDAAIERLRAQGLRALVLDLRANPGGVLTAAVQIASRFVRAGTLVRTQGRFEATVHEAGPEAARYAGLPLVVLVDEMSASASEVLAGALQDHRAAVLVGRPTYGKGVVQTIHRLSDRSGAIKVTTSRYETPAGQRLDHEDDGGAPHGLVPDVWIDADPAVQRAIHEHLARSSPPPRWKGALEAWGRQEGVAILPPAPDDPQLDAALRLFAGERPGPHTVVQGT